MTNAPTKIVPVAGIQHIRTLLVTSWEGGMRELTLQKRLGHTSPEATKIYTRVSDEAVLAEYTRALQARQ